jgi:TM2 domain-containing membrane protein YozV
MGIHRFYTGHTVIGVLQLLTLGGCGIWTLIDLIIIISGNFKDSEGNLIKSA